MELACLIGDNTRGTGMVDQCVKLGMAVVVIALISLALYQFSGRASAVEPNVNILSYR